MDTPASRKQLEQLADEVFELIKLISTARARAEATEPEELSETEFVALDILTKHKSLTVGDIQKEIGILPAQMSRVIRSLENKSSRPMVQCSINEMDRRKVDVQLTDAGRAAHERYQAARRASSLQFLQHLRKEDRDIFMRIIRSFRKELADRLKVE